MDIDFELTRQENSIVPAGGDTYAFASKADGARSSLVSMTEGDASISWELVGTDQNERPVPLASSPAVIDQPTMAVQAAPAAAAESDALALESLQQRAADMKSARSAEEIDSGELTDLAEDIDAYNRQFLNDVSFGESTVTYPDALGRGVDVRYTASKGRIKEDVIVGASGLLTSYTAVIQLNGLQAAIDQQGGVAYSDETGSVIFTTAPPIMYDADGVLSEDIAVDLTVRDGTAYVTYTPDPVWMEAPERTYPVVLDPLYTNTLAQNVQIDTYVHSGNTSSGQNDSSTTLYIGNKSVSGTRRSHYAYWRIKRASMPTLPANTYISSATFSFRLVNGTSTRGAIQLYGVSSSAGEWSSSNMLWSGKPAQGSLIETWAANSSLSSGSLAMSASVTDHVIGWYANGQRTNTGFMLRYSFDDYADHNSLYSSDYRGTDYLNCIPQLVIYYGTPTRTIADGVYFIRNRWSGMYLDLTGNGITNGTLAQQYPKGDHPSEMWQVTYLPETGNYRIEACLANEEPNEKNPPPEKRKVLDARGSDALQTGTRTVIWTPGNYAEQRWKIHSKGNGYYQLAPESNYSLAIETEDGSMASNAKIALAERGPAYAQQWAFELVQTGNGGEYRPMDAGLPPDCFGYSLNINKNLGLPINSWNKSNYTKDHTYAIEAQLENNNRKYRALESHTDPIQSNEYRIAVRVPNGVNGWNFHVIYQLSDGSWAGKNYDDLSKKLGWGDPSITPRMWEDDLFPEWCGTVYYAVSLK